MLTAGVLSTFYLDSTTHLISVAPDADGNLWLGDWGNAAIDRLSMDGTLTKFPAPLNADGYSIFTTPESIAVGPDGNVWFTDVANNNNLIGRLTPTGTLTTFPMREESYSITAGPDGNLWFTGAWSSSGDGIGRITPTGEITVFSGPGVPGGSITAGPDGNLWIMGGDVIGRLTPNGVLTEFSVPEAIASPAAIALEGGLGAGQIITGPDGNLWFTQPATHRIGRITPSGTITEFKLGDLSAAWIAAGADGNIWFPADNADSWGLAGYRPENIMGRLSPTGTLSEYTSLPLSGWIVAGADHNLWLFSSGIVRLDPNAVGAPDSIVVLDSTTTTPFETAATSTASAALTPGAPLLAPVSIVAGQPSPDYTVFRYPDGLVTVQNAYLAQPGSANIVEQDGTLNLAAVKLAPDLLTGSTGNSNSILIAQIKTKEINVNPSVPFVKQVYHDLLKRDAEAMGLDHWLNQLDQGTARAQVVERIENSPEYRTDRVENLYVSLLGRAADPVGLQASLGTLSAGGTLAQIESAILASPEYFALRGGGTTFGFLVTLYQDVFHRQLDPSGAASWGQLLSGSLMGQSSLARLLVVNAVLRSDEASQEIVQGLYHTFLHRAAETGGLQSFVAALKHGSSTEAALGVIVGSDEYFQAL